MQNHFQIGNEIFSPLQPLFSVHVQVNAHDWKSHTYLGAYGTWFIGVTRLPHGKTWLACLNIFHLKIKHPTWLYHTSLSLPKVTLQSVLLFIVCDFFVSVPLWRAVKSVHGSHFRRQTLRLLYICQWLCIKFLSAAPKIAKTAWAREQNETIQVQGQAFWPEISRYIIHHCNPRSHPHLQGLHEKASLS